MCIGDLVILDTTWRDVRGDVFYFLIKKELLLFGYVDVE